MDESAEAVGPAVSESEAFAEAAAQRQVASSENPAIHNHRGEDQREVKERELI
jgi:hypothetical protein